MYLSLVPADKKITLPITLLPKVTKKNSQILIFILILIIVIIIPRKEERNGPYYSFQHVIHIYEVMWASLDEDV